MNNYRNKWLTLLTLVLAGEIIFSLPFHLSRYYRPSFLANTNLSNTELGDIFAVYGITAMMAYFFGGPIADRFRPRTLMALSLITTSLGGLILLYDPTVLQLKILYGYWGLTTILLFWAPLIRSTREWGGELFQGRAFGFLDGGRGLAAAILASGGVTILSNSIESGNGIDALIVYYTIATFLAGILILLAIPKGSITKVSLDRSSQPNLIQNKFLWLQAGVLLVCYCCYKGIDNYSLYFNQVLGMSETESARLAAGIAYARPFSAIAAGLIADKFSPSKSIIVFFSVLILTYLFPATSAPNQNHWLFISTVAVSGAGVFALRGIYFAILEESKIPKHQTGLAVGLISFVGYTPDIFFAPIAGRLLDSAPGVIGHQLYFQMLVFIAILGLIISTILVYFLTKRKNSVT